MSTEHLGADYPFIALNETAKDTIEGAVTSEISGISEMGELPATPAVLEAQHLRKYFPLRSLKLFGPKKVVHAVEDTSLALYPGRALALVGESGSGKTTVARMLARLYEPTAGTIMFHGEPLKGSARAELKAYRRHVQLVFQDPYSSLNPVHDVRYHLKRPL